MKILTHPHASLREICTPVHKNDFGKRLRKQIRQMKKLIMQYGGVGLSAPQVDIPLRFFIAADPNTKIVKPFINPKIIKKAGLLNTINEGCLSLPGISKTVFRRRQITVSYQDLDGVEREGEFSGICGVILQHECDHLDGKLIIDYI